MRITDFHSHILPLIDDGSQSLEMSVTMLRRMADQGIFRVVATPHFYAHSDTPDRFLSRRAEAEQLLRQKMDKQPGLPELIVGAEVYYFPGMSRVDALPSLAIGDTGYILVEMPFCTWTGSMLEELEKIRRHHGLEPIVAHVDRYISPLHQSRLPQTLNEMGITVQANSDFFINRRKRNFAMKLLKAGYIHLLGSDCHNLSDRAPDLSDAIELIAGKLGEAPLSQIEENEMQIFEK